MEEKLVSVLMPVYNVEKYVAEALESIRNQTYKNIEIIVVDDGSTDNTYEIVKEISSFDPRIVLLRNEKNSKIVKTLNKAFSHSRGSYIARMDGDDVSSPDRIERKVRFLEQHPDYHLVGCSVNAISENGELLGKTKKIADYGFLCKAIKYSTPVMHIWVARREVYDVLEGYRELSGVEDYDFLLRMKCAGLRFTNLEEYFGYSIRIERSGNTKGSMGLNQIRLHRYVYRLYKQRRRSGADEFNGDASSLMVTSEFLQRLYRISQGYLVKAIELRKEQSYFMMLLFLLLSIVSPHQAYYLRNALFLRLLRFYYR